MNKLERKIIALAAIRSVPAPTRPVLLRDRIFAMTDRMWILLDLYETIDALEHEGSIAVEPVPGGPERGYHADRSITLKEPTT